MKILKKIYIFSFLVILIAACSPSSLSPTLNGSKTQISPQPYPVTSTIIEDNPYPPQIQNNLPDSYPPITPIPSSASSKNDAYPPVITNSPSENGPVFTINEPLVAGSTDITGTGPKNVPIIIIDISDMGRELAKITINNDGEFSVNLNEPLIGKHAIGIIIGDLSNTNLSYEDYKSSSEYFDIPFIGIVFEKVSVTE